MKLNLGLSGVDVFTAPGFHVFNEPNVERLATFTRSWCRNLQGSGFMFTHPRQYGTWKMRTRISAGTRNPSTKICLLLWPDGGLWPPEIDFNESGDRTRAHQTFHFNPENDMLHTSFGAEETFFHTYGVTVMSDHVDYTYDGVLMKTIPNLAPGTFWNPHARTEPNMSEDVTSMDVQWLSVPD